MTRVVALLRSRTRLAALSTAVSRADLLMAPIRRAVPNSNPEALTEFRRLMREAFAGMSIAPGGEKPNVEVLEESLERVARLASSEAELKVRRAEMVDIFEGVRTRIIAYEADVQAEIVL